MDCVDAKGNLAVKLPKEEKTEGGITIYEHQEHGIELSKTRILQKFLDSLDNKKLKTTLPPSFRSIQAMREDLYLVTETLKTIKKETLESEQQYTFWNWIACFGLHCEHKHQRKVTIGPEKVVGYRVRQLIFPNAERMNICFSDKKEKSFPEEKDGGSSGLGKSLSLGHFRSMKEEMQDMVRVFQGLTEEEQKEVLSCFTKCLSKNEELQNLERRVSEVRRSGELQVEGPAGPLINSLFNAAGILIEERAEAIWDFLDALMELSEERKLVAEALDKGILPLLKDKVESTLEQNWGEQPCDVGCDPEARTLCALYVVVSVLLQLGEKPTSVSS
ncbi:gasdermin-B isoform X1 [Hippopotamus amphibius kiboko]|uniref:gasdermin-B isoform X1 n=1 Tax=Hippopotamus amphibius kiboko TaxID=575201 RepID=UPI00259A9101|nr:gasdermin-B isoform X1 [Hippopotamus amphibius kiboko]